MSLEAFGDDDSNGHEGYVTEEQAQEMFTAGLQAMREMLARSVEKQELQRVAQLMRITWNPTWGIDPGSPEKIVEDCWEV